MIDEVEALGGMTKAIESGMAKLRIEESATRKQVQIFMFLLLLNHSVIGIFITFEGTS